jgi:hypothetical protein
MRQEAAMRSAFIRVSKEFTQKFGNSPIVRQQEGFLFKSHPKLNKDLTEMMGKFKTELYENVSGGMQSAWDLGNELNDDYVEHYFKGLKGFKSTKKFMMDRNTKAMNAFISRKHNTRTLSDRIWKTSNRFRDELEANLLIGIEDGKSASDIAKDTQKYLKRPDDLFRRVRDTEGKLRLSNAAKKFHPGRGVYRSSYKNALRVSRTEVNSAYRMSDHERWKKQDFILGFDINLSAQHPRPDMCDELAGRYPKDFIFPGWHPQCMCNVTPVRMNKKDFIDRLNGKVVNVKPVTNLPTNFTKWMSANKVRIAKMKNKPYFILDNKNILNFIGVKNLTEKELHGFYQRESRKIEKYFSKTENFGEAAALDDYTKDSFVNIRTFLSKDIVSDDSVSINMQKKVDKISNFINKNKVTENLSLNRRVEGSGINFFKKLDVGRVYLDKSFSSTSLKEISHFGDFNIEILVKKGSRVANVANIKEYEYLIDKNSKFKIIEKKLNGVIVELL